MRRKIAAVMRKASGVNEIGIPRKWLAYINSLPNGDGFYEYWQSKPRPAEFVLFEKLGGKIIKTQGKP